MELEERALRAEKALICTTTQAVVLKPIFDRFCGLCTRGKVLENVEQQYMGLVVKLVFEITS